MSSTNKILLIYPKMGLSGALVCHLPLSLVYAATDALAAGFDIKIIDVRLCLESWKVAIAEQITQETILIGISVMTGSPVQNALEISRWLKVEYPQVSIVWGGPHALFNGVEILSENSVSYAICGYGSLPLAQLACLLRGDHEALQCESIPGLVYRCPDTNSVRCVPPDNTFEMINYRDIPYHLIEENLHRYGQLDSGERIFPLYSTLGCPYQCSFCSSPAQYGLMPSKYVLLTPEEVVNHIEMVHSKYHATYIYFIDDDSFVNLDHVAAIIDEIGRRGIQVKLGFRGARINEIMLMDEKYLSMLAGSGTTILHIGAESGSQRMLDLMRKNCTVQDIVAVNRKLAMHPEITAAYNWLVGLPGETLEDLRETRELIMLMVKENPSAIMFVPNQYRPLPGTELYPAAIRFGYKKPEKLEDWIDVEVEGSFQPPWYSKDIANMIDMMQITSYFIDDKLAKITTGNTFKFTVIKFVGRLYSPIAKFRFRFGLTALLVESCVFKYIVRRYKN